MVAVNGRPTPTVGDFHIAFNNGRLGADLGCNALGAPYSQSGAKVTVGLLVSTRKLCSEMSFEEQGSAILRHSLIIRSFEPGRIALASSAGTIDLRR